MNKWIKWIITLSIFALVSIGIFLILNYFGIANITKLRNLIEGSKQYGIMIYFSIMVMTLTLLCFVPLLNTSLIVIGILLFKPLTTFLVCISATLVASSILFLLGKYCGSKLAIKLVGQKDYDYVKDLVTTKGKFTLPLLYVLPGFPDEALALVSGMVGIKYWYLFVVCLVYHVLELGLYCFLGSGLIDWGALSIFDWILCINLLIFDICALMKLEKRINEKKK